MPKSAQTARRYSLYMLRCADGSLYTGIALDVEQRLQQHEDGRYGAKYLRGRQPFSLVFQQPIGDRSAASKAEYRLKRLSRTEKLSLIEGVKDLEDLSVT